MLANFKYLIIVAGLFLTVYGIFQVAVSAWYGGKLPPQSSCLGRHPLLIDRRRCFIPQRPWRSSTCGEPAAKAEADTA
jgi:hypothetical protein